MAKTKKHKTPAIEKLAKKFAPRPFLCDAPRCKKAFTTDGNLQRHKSQAKNHDTLDAAPGLPDLGAPFHAPPEDPRPSRIPTLAEQLEEFGMSAADILADFGMDIDSVGASDDGARGRHASTSEGQAVIDQFEGAGQQKGTVNPPHTVLDTLAAQSQLEYWPFRTKRDYDFAQWTLSESVSNAAMDRLLKLDTVRL